MCIRKSLDQEWSLEKFEAWLFLQSLSIQNQSKPSFNEYQQNKVKHVTLNSTRQQELSFYRRSIWQTLPKSLNISSARARDASDLLIPQTILSDTTVGRSAVEGCISQGYQQIH